jgi:hypothetical protein
MHTLLSPFLPPAALALALSVPLAAQHKEHPEDAYRPPPTTSPSVAPSTIVTRGPFRSIQVNVNGAGNNIPNDAANEPTIAIDPTNRNRIVIGWRQFDNIASNFRQAGYARSSDAGATWTFPGSLQPGSFNSDPVLDTDTSGTFYYLGYPSGSTLTLWKSFNGGVTWTSGVTLPGGDKAWMVVDQTGGQGNGHIYCWWQYFTTPPLQFTRSTNGGASFSAALDVAEDVTFGTLAIDSSGTLFAGGLFRQTWSAFRVGRSTNAKNAGVTPTFAGVTVAMNGEMGIQDAPNPGGLMGQAEVATDPSRPSNVYMLCSVDPTGGDPMDVHFVRSTNSGLSFSAPVRVNDDAPGANAWQWFGTMSCSPNGRIDAIWNDTRTSQQATLSETCYSFSLDAGTTWSKNIPIGPQWNSVVGWPNQSKIGDYYDLVSTNDAGHLAYSATYNGEQDVYYVKLGDCNGNGVHDGVDIRDGTSFDSNVNTIPDECETCQPSLGFANSALKLTVCGDPLTLANSKATLLVENGEANRTLLILISPGRFDPPFPFLGAQIVPDPGFAGTVQVVTTTDGTGRKAIVLGGKPNNPVTVYLQGLMISAQNALVASNAVAATVGTSN